MSVAIIDYNMGNLASIRRSFEECGASVFVTNNPKDLAEAERIVLPGVGSFYDGMQHLANSGFKEALQEEVQNKGKPLLGICLGMQLLSEAGTEGKSIEGLGFIKGKVEKIIPQNAEKVPHVGWNELIVNQHNPVLKGIEKECDFYFVHSYHFVAKNDNDIVARTPYCGEIVSVVAKDNIFGVQFHPEKSQKSGFALIKNFLEI